MYSAFGWMKDQFSGLAKLKYTGKGETFWLLAYLCSDAHRPMSLMGSKAIKTTNSHMKESSIGML